MGSGGNLLDDSLEMIGLFHGCSSVEPKTIKTTDEKIHIPDAM